MFAKLVFDEGLAGKEQIKKSLSKLNGLIKSGKSASLAGVMVASGLLSKEKAREIWQQRTAGSAVLIGGN